LKFLFVGVLIDVWVVLVGAVGFRLLEGVAWLDACLDAALVMTGNGPTSPALTSTGKLFLAVYALAGGGIYVVVVALVLAPALHRLLHTLHLRAPDDP
jgi:hypothetical protein